MKANLSLQRFLNWLTSLQGKNAVKEEIDEQILNDLKKEKKEMDFLLELAKNQFNDLIESSLDKNRHCVGAKNEVTYDLDKVGKITIRVDGYWEKRRWFKWECLDKMGNKIASGTKW